MSNYEIKFAGFEDALALKNALAAELSESKLSLDSVDLSGGMDSVDVDSFLGAALKLDSSLEIQTALFKCLESSLYDDKKIVRETFDDVKAIEDYYPIMFECAKVNLSPFFKKLGSKLTGLNLEALIGSLKSK